MPLQKQNISISFGQGLDTKTDPNQVIAGQFLSLQNIIFTSGMQFQKRNGYSKLATIPSGVNSGIFQSELIGFDGSSLYSYNAANQNTVNKGAIIGVNISAQSIYRNANAQTQQDSAFHSKGLYLFVWNDSVNNNQYIVVNSTTGNQVIAATSLVSTAVRPRAWALGNYLIVTYVDSATNHLRYISIPVNNLSGGASSPVDISTQVNASNPNYDGLVTQGNLYLSWNASDGGGAIRTAYIDPQLNQHNTVVKAGEAATSCIGLFADEMTNPATIWVAYCDGSNIRYFVLRNSDLSSILSPTQVVGSLSNINNITGLASNGSGTLLYQTQNTYSFSSTRSDFVTSVTATSGGSVGSPVVFLRSVGLISKFFSYQGNFYVVLAYSGSLQPTYFVVNSSGTILAKLAYGNGGGYTSLAKLTTVNFISSTSFQLAYLFKDLLTTQSGQVYTQTGVNSAILDFTSSQLFQSTEIGSNLNITGGFLWAYDGYGPTEQNFHLYPEDIGFTASSASTGIFANSYSYTALYEWTDNQGNIQFSTPSIPVTVTTANASTGITLKIPTLRLTAKKNTISPVSISLYRTAPTVATNIYYKVSSITSPKLNDVTIDSVDITDTKNDADIIGNQLLYTTGGVLPNTGGPPSIDSTLYKNRLILIDAENQNELWVSKTVLPNTPVELSAELAFPIDSRFGGMKVVFVMDDKLIIFKPNAIFYLTGDGPDSTGANNDFSEAVFITSVVGCSNPKSVVLTQNGIMFQSNKGIWLLDRSLGINYIGAPVEAFNSNVVTSAVLIPNTTQVRFTLDNGIALVYDYFYKVWGTFTNHNANGAVLFQNLFTYLTPAGIFLQESPNIYTDNGNPFYMQLTSSWLSLSGLQGFQRAYRLFLLGNFISPHILTISVAYDFNPSNVQSTVIRPTVLNNTTYGSDPFYGAGSVYGGRPRREQYRINFARQKCQSIQITILEGTDTNTPVYGASLNLEAMGIVIGSKGTYPRIPATQYLK